MHLIPWTLHSGSEHYEITEAIKNRASAPLSTGFDDMLMLFMRIYTGIFDYLSVFKGTVQRDFNFVF